MRTVFRTLAIAMMAAMLTTISSAAGAQDATPPAPATITCADVAATPSAGHGPMHGSTPAGHAGHGMAMAEFDLMYIDMMIPHHESIIALAEVALPELTDPRLIEMAQNIIDTQTAENQQMHDLRDQWYPGAEAVTMDQMMDMPGIGGDMALMDQVMSAEWQVTTFCAAADKDLAFIEQAIPHHRMAIAVSEAALTQAVHPELKAVAEDVIAAQRAEIEQLEAILAELTGEATPAG